MTAAGCRRRVREDRNGRYRGEADRAPLLADAERLEDLHHARGVRARLQGRAGEHRQGRPVQGRLPRRSRRTIACRPSSIPTARTASRSRSSSSGAILQYLGRKTGKFYPHGRALPRRGRAVVVLADGRPWAAWPGRRTISAPTRPRRSPTRSIATPTRSTASTACSTSVSPIANSSPVTIPSPTSPPSRGRALWDRQGQDIAQFPRMKSWLDAIAARPAVQRGLAIRSEDRGRVDLAKDEEARKILFGQRAS